MKQIFTVRTNNRDNILVKAEQDDLERLFRENKIIDYTFPKIYKIKDEKLT